MPVTCRKRSTCPLYAWECIFPYPLLLRFPSIQLNSVEVKSSYMLSICIKLLSSVQPHVRTCTRSRIFTPVADVLQKYLCTRINPVFISIDRVHILIDVERKRKAVQECHIEIAPQRITRSPAHHQGSPKILQRAFIATNSRHIAHAKQK